MFTTLDKALVALVMGFLSVLNLVFGWHIIADPAVVSGVIAAITPILVYFVPNKKPAT